MKRTPFKRKTWMRLGKKRSKYATRQRDTEFMLWVKTLPCAVYAGISDPVWMTHTPCGGAVEADHMGERGLSRKAVDDTCVPMCTQHHAERTIHTGAFKFATREDGRAWRAVVIEATQAMWRKRQQQT